MVQYGHNASEAPLTVCPGCLSAGVPAEAVEGQYRAAQGHAGHQGSAGGRHWELHLRVTVWELFGAEDHRAVCNR